MKLYNDSYSQARLGDMVVVTINYRLGALGFFASEEIVNENSPGQPTTGSMNGVLDVVEVGCTPYD